MNAAAMAGRTRPTVRREASSTSSTMAAPA